MNAGAAQSVKRRSASLRICRKGIASAIDCADGNAAGIRGARIEVIEDCGHLSTLEQPAAVNAALRRWLAA